MTHQLGSTFSSKDRTFDMIRVLCKQRSGLNVCHINAQSLRNKIDEFRYIFENSGVDVICITETWLNKSVTDDFVGLQEYKLFRCDRETLGGGVSVYIKKNICSKILCKSNSQDVIEYLFIEIQSRGNKLLLGCVYRPNRRICTQNFHSVLENVAIGYEDIIVCGDFNSNILTENKILDDMHSIGMYPTNTTTPTHYSTTVNTLLDIFFVGNQQKVLLYDQLAASCFSRHDLIFVSYNFNPQYNSSTKTYYDFKNINQDALLSEMTKVDWDSIYYIPSADDQLTFLETNVENVFSKSVPIKPVSDKNVTNRWFNSDIENAIIERDLIFRRWKLYKTEILRMEYCSARRRVNKLIKKAKTDHYSRVFSSAINSKKTWKTLNEIGLGKSRPETETDVDIDELNEKFTESTAVNVDVNFYNHLSVTDQFDDNSFSFSCVHRNDVIFSCFAVKSNAMGLDNIHPKFLKIVLPLIISHITFIFNTILTKSTFPERWKNAKILPIPKSGNDFRPIAILPFLSKVFEKLLHTQLSEYLRLSNLLTDRQSGFREKRSCITALIDVSEDIRENVDAGNISLLILLDHSKAFDSVNHKVLSKKLKTMFNLSFSSTSLISSYLENRSQCVSANGGLSRQLPVPNGVPQGSILGPLLFTLYVNDLVDHLHHCNCHVYADDVQIYISCSLDELDNCVRKINEDLHRVQNWASGNYLSINPKKSKCLVIRPRLMKFRLEPNIFINSQRIEVVDNTKNLGIKFNNTLTWSDHILSVTGRTYGMLRSLWNAQYFTPISIRTLLAKTYLLPTLLYGCELFANTDGESIARLNGAFNAVIRYVYGLRKYDHISPFVKKLFNVNFFDLLKIRALILLHKIIYTHEPSYLYNRLRFTRSSRTNDLIPQRRRCLMSEWHFYINSIYLWNKLPSNIQFISNTATFKKAIFDYFS